MLGGLVDGLGSFDNSTVNIKGGHAYNVETWGNGKINVSGGTVDGLSARINGTITISENASTISVHAFDFGKVIMTGGTAYYLGAGENGIVDLFGGEIIDSLSAGGSSLVNIYGNYLTKFQTGGKYNFGYVHGFWFDSDSTEFTIDLSGSETYSRINLIPEPASLLLFGFGALVLRRKR
jgi:hypothetical protein